MKIRDFELKDQTVLEIGKFAILWNWFEKEFCHNECNYKELKKVAPETSCQGLFIKKISNSIICCTMLVVYVIWLYN